MIYLIGLITGVITGLALGGGAILIPFLVIFMEVQQHMAQGVTLISFLPMSIIAIITHYKQGNIQTKLIVPLALGSIVGAIGGAIIAMHFSSDLLTNIYGTFLVLMGCYEFYSARVK
ncbi:sulfite exporter TauE/SafE family protein [Natranaerobius trueperi]|uniref:Probable membrane transporter protein n=1 Tax=Natranaerobius trueperi TaxID=759412 RepID=A0A226C2D3_9FIRM|nr:sulfite exporter TauE/SafE family protein [Natranaerobius trueperi]OWZ84567.1 permease [Natranaerobius trueperi]